MSEYVFDNIFWHIKNNDKQLIRDILLFLI